MSVGTGYGFWAGEFRGYMAEIVDIRSVGAGVSTSYSIPEFNSSYPSNAVMAIPDGASSFLYGAPHFASGSGSQITIRANPITSGSSSTIYTFGTKINTGFGIKVTDSSGRSKVAANQGMRLVSTGVVTPVLDAFWNGSRYIYHFTGTVPGVGYGQVVGLYWPQNTVAALGQAYSYFSMINQSQFLIGPSAVAAGTTWQLGQVKYAIFDTLPPASTYGSGVRIMNANGVNVYDSGSRSMELLASSASPTWTDARQSYVVGAYGRPTARLDSLGYYYAKNEIFISPRTYDQTITEGYAGLIVRTPCANFASLPPSYLVACVI